MSDIYQISPWYNTEEWNRVYNNIFEQTSTFTTKQNALDQLLIWKARCPSLPSGIEATLSLLNVHIQDQGQHHEICNDHLLRLAYSSALMRFVNHMFDKETAKGLSLFQAAKTFGVPEWIIELRHDTAHSNNLPQLGVLREATAISLNWLQKKYWDTLKSCISDLIVGKVYNETETEKQITALMNFCISLSICSHPKCNLVKLADINDTNLRENLINDAQELLEDSLNFSNFKTIGFATLRAAIHNKAKKILINESMSSFVNKALLSDESAFISLDMYKGLDHYGYYSDKALKRSYVQCFAGLLNFLHTHDLLRDFLLELIKITQNENECCAMKCKLAAKWTSVILEALKKNQQFREMINKDTDITSKDEKEIIRLYYHWYPSDSKRSLLLDLRKPVPHEFTNISFVQPIISTFNPYLVFFIKDLLSLVRPKLPDSVKVKICQLAKVIASPDKFPVISSKIYTADDLDIANNFESDNQSKQDEDIEIIDVQIEDEPNDDMKQNEQKFGIWHIAPKNAGWATCPIGQLPWTQLPLEPMETVM